MINCEFFSAITARSLVLIAFLPRRRLWQIRLIGEPTTRAGDSSQVAGGFIQPDGVLSDILAAVCGNGAF